MSIEVPVLPGASAGPLTADAVERDVAYLIETVRRQHPSRAELTVSPEPRSSLLTLYRAVSCSLATLHDAHSTAIPPNSAQGFGLRFLWASDGLTVRQGSRFMEVLGIGGLRPEQIMDRSIPLVSAENAHWRRSVVARLLETASGCAALGLLSRGNELVVRCQRGKYTDVLRPGPRRMRAVVAPSVEWRVDPSWRWAILRLDRCLASRTETRDINTFFRWVIQRSVPRVVIDLRNNRGGNSATVDAILRHLPITRLRPYGPGTFGGTRELLSPDYALTHSGVRYGGDLFVWTAAETFSAAVWLATLLRDNGLARAVGAPTGGAPTGFGEARRHRLPDSGLHYTVATAFWWRPDATHDDDRTLHPDIFIPTTVADLVEGRDPLVEWLRSSG